MFNIMTPSDVSVSSPLRNSQDVNFPGDVIMKHWFKFLSQGENGKSIHECNKCSARVKWQGKKFGCKTFTQHVKTHSKWQEETSKAVEAEASQKS